MGKPIIKTKTTKPTKTVSEAPAPTATATVKKAGRDTVLVKLTPNQLATLIGGDTEVQVGRKDLKRIQTELVLAKAGI